MYYQRHIPNPTQHLSFSLQDFSGGLNNRASTQLQDNQASYLINMAFADEILMEKRDGTDYYSEKQYDGTVSYMDEYHPYQEPNKLVVATESSLYIDDAVVASVSGKVRGTTYMGRYYFLDGTDIRVYGKFSQNDIEPYLKVQGTPVDDYVVFKLVNPPEDFTPLGTEHERGVEVYDYDTMEMWYEPCENEIADAFKGSNVIPESAKYIAVLEDRLYISGVKEDDDNVYISDVGNGLYFPVYLPIQLPPNGDKITSLHVFHNSVVVGRKNDVHVIYGNTNRTDVDGVLYRLKRINTHTGIASNESVQLVHNYMFYIGYDGNAYAMHTTQTNVDILATQILNHTVDFYANPISADNDKLADSFGVFYNDYWYVSMGDKLVIYSYRHQAWTVYEFFGFNVTSMYIHNHTLILGADIGRIVTFTKDAYSDLGKPYQAVWESKVYDFGEPSTFKQFREFYLVSHTYDSFTSGIRIKIEVDYSEVTEYNFSSNVISVWGRARYGDRYVHKNISMSSPILVGRRGRGVKIILENGYFETASVPTYNDIVQYPGLKQGMLFYVEDEEKYYAYHNHQFEERPASTLFEPMKVYEINGQYDMRGKR